MRSVATTAVLLAAIVLVACSSVRTDVTYDENASFEGLATYAWNQGPRKPSGDYRLDDPTLHQQVRAAIDRHLGARFELVEDGSQDFTVRYHGGIERTLDTISIDDNYYSRVHSFGRSDRVTRQHTVVQEYEEGTLVIDIADPAGSSLLWRGSVRGVLRRNPTLAERQRRLDEAVEGMLRRFPPR